MNDDLLPLLRRAHRALAEFVASARERTDLGDLANDAAIVRSQLADVLDYAEEHLGPGETTIPPERVITTAIASADSITAADLTDRIVAALEDHGWTFASQDSTQAMVEEVGRRVLAERNLRDLNRKIVSKLARCQEALRVVLRAPEPITAREAARAALRETAP